MPLKCKSKFQFKRSSVEFSLTVWPIILCLYSLIFRNHYAEQNKHLTFDDRRVILFSTKNNSSKKAIADTIRKDPTIVAKRSVFIVLKPLLANILITALFPQPVMSVASFPQ